MKEKIYLIIISKSIPLLWSKINVRKKYTFHLYWSNGCCCFVEWQRPFLPLSLSLSPSFVIRYTILVKWILVTIERRKELGNEYGSLRVQHM